MQFTLAIETPGNHNYTKKKGFYFEKPCHENSARERRLPHLLPCCSSMRCSALSRSLCRDAWRQQTDRRYSLLCGQRDLSRCSSMVWCSEPGQKPRGRRFSPGGSDPTTWRTAGGASVWTESELTTSTVHLNPKTGLPKVKCAIFRTINRYW